MKDLVDRFVAQGRGEQDYSGVATLLL
jgi:hypothetical protein